MPHSFQRPALQRLALKRPALKRLSRTLTISSLLLAGTLPFASRAQDAAPAEPTAPAGPLALDTKPDPLFTRATAVYDAALQNRVDKQGLIDYAKLKGDRSLDAFVAALPQVDVSAFPAFEVKGEPDDKDKARSVAGRKPVRAQPKIDRSWELSFWINAQNAIALKTFADAYPISSPDDIKDLSTRKFAVARGQYTLDELRQKAGKIDPRAAFSMIDGTTSGPRLAPRALRAYGINGTLDAGVSALINDPRQVELQRIQNIVIVPPFLASVDEMWKPRTARRKWDGIRYLLSAYTSASANRNYFTTNEYQVLFGSSDRKLNRIPSAFTG